MPRKPQHPLHRHAVPHPDGLEDEYCQPFADTIAHASHNHSIDAQRKAMAAAIAMSSAMVWSNHQQFFQKRKVGSVIVDYLAKLDALGRSLKAAGVRSWQTTAAAVITIGFNLYWVPIRLGLPSIVQHWRYHPDITWKHWVIAASACRTDVAQFPMNYIPCNHEDICRVDMLGPNQIDPLQHEFTFSVDDYYQAVSDNYLRCQFLLSASVERQLSAEQLRKQQPNMMRKFRQHSGPQEPPQQFSARYPATVSNRSVHRFKFQYMSAHM